MRRTVLLLAVLFIVAASGLAHAHEVRPGYLEVRQTGDETFEIMWKVPARGDLRLGIHATLPESCNSPAPPSTYRTEGAWVDHWTVTCPGGLTGQSIGIDGLSATLTDALVRVERSDGTTQVARLTPSAPSFTVEAAPSRIRVAGTYLRLGVEHILGGIDHLLFVLALLIIVTGWGRLFKTITAFTLAHSVTLALAALGFVHVPSAPVEAVIALSILFLASEIARGRQGRLGLTQQYPWVVAFTFGLLHGFGFAGALREVGLPETAIPLALFLFNVGVEIGQVLFVAGVLGLVWTFRRLETPWPAWAWRVPTYAIGTIAAFWMIQRVTAFWP